MTGMGYHSQLDFLRCLQGSLHSLWTSYSPIVNFSDREETLEGFLDKFPQSSKIQKQEVEMEQKHPFGEIVLLLLMQMILGWGDLNSCKRRSVNLLFILRRPGGHLEHRTCQLELSSQEDHWMYLICPGVFHSFTVCCWEGSHIPMPHNIDNAVTLATRAIQLKSPGRFYSIL